MAGPTSGCANTSPGNTSESDAACSKRISSFCDIAKTPTKGWRTERPRLVCGESMDILHLGFPKTITRRLVGG
jgi:hypothetical protein